MKFNVCLVEFPSYRALDTVDQGVGLKEGGWGVSCRMGRWVVWGKEEGVGNATGNIGHVEDWNEAGHTAAFQPHVSGRHEKPRGLFVLLGGFFVYAWSPSLIRGLCPSVHKEHKNGIR